MTDLTKLMYYDYLTAQLAPYWEQDQVLCESDPDLWQEIRDRDDWLVHRREDEAVSLELYGQYCEALLRIFRPVG